MTKVTNVSYQGNQESKLGTTNLNKDDFLKLLITIETSESFRTNG